MKFPRYAALIVLLGIRLPCLADTPTVTVGSKTFTESYILAEILAQVLEDTHQAKVVRRFGIGGTGLMYHALESGDIDLYPEYSGTISEAILKNPSISSIADIQTALGSLGLILSESLGFNNTYALAVKNQTADQRELKSISDLSRYPEIRAGLSHEFMKRPDGLPGLMKHYGLKLDQVKSIEHSLAYEALARDEIEMTDVYSTDAKIEKLGLTVLKDDRGFFPTYFAVILARRQFVEKYPVFWETLKHLQGRISEKEMIRLNALADLERKSFSKIAAEYLQDSRRKEGVPGNPKLENSRADEGVAQKIVGYTKQHLYLVAISLLISIGVGLPLGILSARARTLGQFILIFSGVIQTIPSLALLCFLIPIFGIGTPPALFALFIYGLLPIVLNTYLGLKSLDPRLIESAEALGLSNFQRLKLIELPLASRSILGGIKTSAIISIGTATLAALIGAGGYGAPIVTGLALNDLNIILQGAIPAAIMALGVHGCFEILNHWIIPKGLK